MEEGRGKLIFRRGSGSLLVEIPSPDDEINIGYSTLLRLILLFWDRIFSYLILERMIEKKILILFTY